MANNRNDEPTEEQGQDLRENNDDDNDNKLAQGLKDAQLVTRKPGIKPS